METPPKPTPDCYSCWSKLDTWTLKDSALLLHALDPLEYRQVKFNLREVPNVLELKDAYKTFLILNNVTRNQRYSDNSGIPIEIIYAVVEQKELPIPKELKSMLDQRFQKQQAQQEAMLAKQPLNRPMFTRERQNFLKQIAVMTHILMDCEHPVYEFSLNGRPNALNIRQAMLDKADKLRVSQEGLKSSHRKIADALEFLEEEADN